MFGKLTNLFKKNFSNTIVSFGRVCGPYTPETGRVNNAGKHDFWEYSKRKLDPYFSDCSTNEQGLANSIENRNWVNCNDGDVKKWIISSWVVVTVGLIAYWLVTRKVEEGEEEEDKASEVLRNKDVSEEGRAVSFDQKTYAYLKDRKVVDVWQRNGYYGVVHKTKIDLTREIGEDSGNRTEERSENQNVDNCSRVEMYLSLKNDTPLSWQLLQYMAYLDVEGVHEEFMIHVMDLTKEDLKKQVTELVKLSLMNVVDEGNEIILKVRDETVQEETKKALIEEDATKVKSVIERLIKTLYNIFDNIVQNDESEETLKEALRLIKQFKILIKEIKAADLVIREHAMLMLAVGSYYKEVIIDHKEAVYYWEELLSNQKLIDTVDSPNELKGILFDEVGEFYLQLGGEGDVEKGLGLHLASLILNQEDSENYVKIGLSFNQLGIDYSNLAGGGLKQSLEYFKKALESFLKDPSCNGKYIEEVLFRLGLATLLQKGGEEVLEENEKRAGVRYLEEALNYHYRVDFEDWVRTAEIIAFIAFAYNILGDEDKALEYEKQAYSILLAELGSEDEKTKKSQLCIENFQPNFFARKGILLEQGCFGGKKVGNEYRFIITSRGVTDENLIKVKQKIQKSVLKFLIQGIENGTLVKKGFLSSSDCIVETDIKKELNGLGDADNIELARMLCFESINLSIMKSEKKAYDVVESFTRENLELVKKIAVEHPEFFVDGSIVKACVRGIIQDQSFASHIFEHVKYVGMGERRKALSTHKERGVMEESK